MGKFHIAFMCSSDFGIPAFETLVRGPRYHMVGLITQPDRPAGRGREVTTLSIKQIAITHGVPVLQPPDLRHPDAIQKVRELAPDVIVVAAYGQWIPAEVYDIPPRRSLNIHPSLLPRHRGAAPAMSAILSGDTETGVTVIFVAGKMDTGDVLGQVRQPISPEDTTATLMSKLSLVGATLIADVLPKWLGGKIQPQPQDHSKATWFGRVKKEQGQIDWAKPAEQIWREVRAYNPWPSAYTFCEGKRLVIHEAWPLPGYCGDAIPGEVIPAPEGLAVATGDGALLLRQVQLEGKRPMTGQEFLRGQRHLLRRRLGF